jgi:tetratricopeptide (TPR) repeat protein
LTAWAFIGHKHAVHVNQLSAHLDRGWDLAQKGDAAGALACARRALEVDPKSPEVHNLLGFAAALDGDTEEAIEHYRQAVTLDETYFEAMLNAAEILISPLGSYDEALAMCNDALDYAETNEEIADCVLLKVDALMGKGVKDEAAKVLGMVPPGPYENPSYDYLIGRAYYEVGQIDRALPLVEDAVKRDPMHADARYYLGMIKDEKGDAAGATDAFLHARALDVRQPALPWSPSPEAFGAIVRQVVAKLDNVLARFVREAEVYCFDVVGPELVVDGVDPRALVILDASPGVDRGDGADASQANGDIDDDSRGRRGRIFVYQRNVERAAGSLGAMDEELFHALEREIANVFVEAPNEETPIDKGKLN